MKDLGKAPMAIWAIVGIINVKGKNLLCVIT